MAEQQQLHSFLDEVNEEKKIKKKKKKKKTRNRINWTIQLLTQKNSQ
jgi:hypothetical protein